MRRIEGRVLRGNSPGIAPSPRKQWAWNFGIFDLEAQVGSSAIPLGQKISKSLQFLMQVACSSFKNPDHSQSTEAPVSVPGSSKSSQEHHVQTSNGSTDPACQFGVPHPPVKAKLETAILGCHGDQVLLTSSEESRCGCLHKVILNAGEPVTSHTTFSLEARYDCSWMLFSKSSDFVGLFVRHAARPLQHCSSHPSRRVSCEKGLLDVVFPSTKFNAFLFVSSFLRWGFFLSSLQCHVGLFL